MPRAEIEGEMGDAHMGVQARLMSQALRKLTGAVSRSGTCIIFINQIRMKIGVVFGNPETTTGGNALKFYSSVRCEIRRAGNLKDGDVVVGTRTRVKVVKNKVAPPFQEAEFDIIYDRGISRAGEVLDLGVQLGLIEKSGSHYALAGERIGTGSRAGGGVAARAAAGAGGAGGEDSRGTAAGGSAEGGGGVRLLAFVVAFLGLLGVQLVWQPGAGVARPGHCRRCSVERRVGVKRPAAVRGRVRGDEVRVCRARPPMR